MALRKLSFGLFGPVFEPVFYDGEDGDGDENDDDIDDYDE